jgi:hypothetical protein
MTKTIAAQLERHSSNGSKVAECVACHGEIQPYTGRPVSLYSKRFAHQPGQCRDAGERAAQVRELVDQGDLFAWSCCHVEPAAEIPVVCNELGTDKAAYVAHMRTHGATALKVPARPRLRKTAPAASLPKLEVNPLKWITWTENNLERKGQFWSEGPDPHSVWVVPLRPATWEVQGKPAKPVCLYAHGDGSWSTDWSRATWDRREVNRKAKNAA